MRQWGNTSKMKVQATITFKIEYDLEEDFDNIPGVDNVKEMLELETIYVKNNVLDFIEDRMGDLCDITTNVTVVS